MSVKSSMSYLKNGHRMKHYYAFLYFSISIATTSIGMHDQALLQYMPDDTVYAILKYLSTDQLLKYREVSKQAQKRAKHVLINDYSKIIRINPCRPQPLPLVNKFSHLVLPSVTGLGQRIYFYTIMPHLKVLCIHLQTEHIVGFYERETIKNLLKNCPNVERLKIYFPQWKYNNNHYYWHEELLQAIPIYSNLRKLHLTSAAKAQWDTLLRLLPQLKNLQVLLVARSCPNTDQFTQCIQLLRKLLFFRKLCLCIAIEKQNVPAFGTALATLNNLQILDLSKSTLNPEDILLFHQLLSPLRAAIKWGVLNNSHMLMMQAQKDKSL